jgi:hypothetical protein
VRIDVGGVAQPKLAFPWTFPLGAALTLGLGVALGRTPSEPVAREAESAARTSRESRALQEVRA